MSQKVVDQSVRYELLDPLRSFIVQAPAGSGKTELLTQRILALLTIVEKPENILAITFTRKAAAEMQHRVISALHLATGPEPEAAHEKYRWQLATKVLQRDREKGWRLLENASRLNMTTIDSLSSSLSAALPLLSQTGALPNITENAMTYYVTAAENLMQSVSDKDEVSQHIMALLKHKDNNLSQVTELIAQMLSKRLQWMSTIAGHSRNFQKKGLLDSLKIVVFEKLQAAYRSLPADILSELPELLTQASQVLRKNEKAKKPFLKSLDFVPDLRSPKIEDLPVWKAISEMFLKAGSKPELLSSFTKANGFPTEKDAESIETKAAYKRNKLLISEIAALLKNTPGVAEILLQVKLLPDNIEKSVSQQALKSVVALLPVAVAHLKLIFSRYNVIDFSELALSSLEALGHEDMPSDLALALDYRLEHILIDEFQDTSTPQIELIKLLTAGWDNTSSKTLFLVGDPMQSIYRFRDANVSLFMQIRSRGIGQIQLDFRQLKVNFRSKETIVEWVNQQFSRIMPVKEDLTFAAVTYASSVAFNQSDLDTSVECYLTVNASHHFSQARKILDLVRQHLQDNQTRQMHKTLAILARSRGHLSEIIQLLNQESIPYQALEIDKLSEKMLVRDLTRLAFALCDQYDELSWSACMRSPWFGLSLNDIRQILITTDDSLSMLQRIKSARPSISQVAKDRVDKILPILQVSVDLKGRKPFRKWLAGCFEALGGFSQLDFESDVSDLNACLDKIAELEEGGELNDRQAVVEAIEKLYAAPNPTATSEVQIMTIHKSKGLEFDSVILPRLDAGKPPHDSVLLKWTEVLDTSGESHNLLAISKQTGEESDSVYKYISYLESQKLKYEDQRVLYVAATRARSKLFLLGNIKSDNEKGTYRKPTTDSYLSMLWSGVEENFRTITTDAVEMPEEKMLYQSRQIKRVNIECVTSIPDLELSSQNDIIQMDNTSRNSDETSKSIDNELARFNDWIPESAVAIGNVMHRQLQWLAETFYADDQLPEHWKEITRAQLINEYSFSPEELEIAVDKVVSGIANTLKDEFGQFLLGARENADAELILHKKIDSGSFLTRVVDRTFVSENVRWIVDYKSSAPEEGESMEHFLEKETSAYLQQINDYFKMFDTLEQRKIIAGLYFPMLSHFEKIMES